jgi:1,4-alpha-glucan branching enzyme/maltooligosyltrehalose trehalohydrolase
VGNRARGERIALLTDAARIRAATVLLLLAPAPPLLFMGEEWGCTQPFLFFCDFGPELADQVVAGRRQEFAQFPQFSDPESRQRIPDPLDTATFRQSVLDWTACERPGHRDWLVLHRELLAVRRREVIPRLPGIAGQTGSWTRPGERAICAHWMLGDGSTLSVLANLGDTPLANHTPPSGTRLYSTHSDTLVQQGSASQPPWSVTWVLHTGDPGA